MIKAHQVANSYGLIAKHVKYSTEYDYDITYASNVAHLFNIVGFKVWRRGNNKVRIIEVIYRDKGKILNEMYITCIK